MRIMEGAPTRRSFIESLSRGLATEIHLFIDLEERAFIYRSCREILPRGLLRRSCQQSSFTNFYKDTVKGSCQETSFRDLVQISRHKVSCRALCQESSFRELVQRSLKQIFPRDLLQGACTESLPQTSQRDLVQRACQRPLVEILCGEPGHLLWRSFTETLRRDLL